MMRGAVVLAFAILSDITTICTGLKEAAYQEADLAQLNVEPPRRHRGFFLHTKDFGEKSTQTASISEVSPWHELDLPPSVDALAQEVSSADELPRSLGNSHLQLRKPSVQALPATAEARHRPRSVADSFSDTHPSLLSKSPDLSEQANHLKSLAFGDARPFSNIFPFFSDSKEGHARPSLLSESPDESEEEESGKSSEEAEPSEEESSNDAEAPKCLTKPAEEQLRQVFQLFVKGESNRVPLDDVDPMYKSTTGYASGSLITYSPTLAKLLHAFGLTRFLDPDGGPGRGFLQREVEQMNHEFFTMYTSDHLVKTTKRVSKFGTPSKMVHRLTFTDFVTNRSSLASLTTLMPQSSCGVRSHLMPSGQAID